MRFPAAALGCCPRAGVESRAGLEAGAGAGPRAGTCPPPTAAGRPPPRGSPPRPLSCAKAATQIRTDSPIIFFTSTSLAKSRPLNLLHAMRQLKPADLFGCEQNVLFAPGHAVLGVLTHALSRAGLGSPCALQSIRRANWLFLLVLLPDLAAQAADVCNPTDLVGPYARAPWWPHASLPMQGATLWRVTCIGKAYEEARR